jgi:hypothetical protein
MERTGRIKESNEESLPAVIFKQTMIIAMKLETRLQKSLLMSRTVCRKTTVMQTLLESTRSATEITGGGKAKSWSSKLENKHMREMRLEHRCKPNNLCDKGGIKMCITKAKLDMISKVWGTSSGTSLVLSLKGEKGLTPKMTADKKREKALTDRKDAKTQPRQKSEFCLKTKVRFQSNLIFVRRHVFVLQVVDDSMQGRGMWRMLHQGVEIPLLKLDTVIEHDDRRVATMDVWGALEEVGKEGDNGDSETGLMESVEDVGTDATEDGKP